MKDVMAFDLASGELAWRTPFEHGNAYGSAAVARVGGESVVVTCTGAVVRVRDGLSLAPGYGGHSYTSPVTAGSIAYFLGNAEAGTQVVFRLPASAATPAGRLPATFLEGGTPLALQVPGWPNLFRHFHVASPLLAGGLGYAISNAGVLTVAEIAEAGPAPRIVSQTRLPLDSWGVTQPYPYTCGACASPAMAGDRIYVVGNAGTTCVLEPGREGRIAAVNRIESPFRGQRKSAYNYLFTYWPDHLEGFVTSPVFDGNRIYLRGEQHLYCIGDTSGPTQRPRR